MLYRLVLRPCTISRFVPYIRHPRIMNDSPSTKQVAVSPPHVSEKPKPRRRRKNKTTDQPSHEPDSYAVAGSLESDYDSETNLPIPQATTIIKTQLSPPIIVPISAWRKAAPKLMSSPTYFITNKLFKDDSVKIQCMEIQMFRIVQKWFQKTNIGFYTFPIPDKKTFKIVIKGISPEISENEVLE